MLSIDNPLLNYKTPCLINLPSPLSQSPNTQLRTRPTPPQEQTPPRTQSMGTVENKALPQKSKDKNVSPIAPPTALKNQKASRGRGSACAAGICSGVRKSQRSEAPEDGSGEVLHALSLRSAEPGIYKKFLANRSGARPPGLRNA